MRTLFKRQNILGDMDFFLKNIDILESGECVRKARTLETPVRTVLKSENIFPSDGILGQEDILR